MSAQNKARVIGSGYGGGSFVMRPDKRQKARRKMQKRYLAWAFLRIAVAELDSLANVPAKRSAAPRR